MPDPIPSHEVTMQTVASKEQVTGRGLNANQRRANATREQYVRDGAPKTIAGFADTAPKRSQIEGIADDNIGTERDAAGKKVRTDPDTQKRYEDTLEYVDRIYNYLDGGVDGMTTSQKKEAIASVEMVFRSLPEADKILSGISDPKVLDEMMTQALRDPEMRKIVLAKLQEIKNTGSNKADDLSKKELAEQEARSAKELKEKEQERIVIELKAIENQLDKYSPNGELTLKLNNLETELPGLKREKIDAENNLRLLNSQIGDIRTNLTILAGKKSTITDYDTLFQGYNAQLMKLEEQKRDHEEKIAAFEETEVKKKQLEEGKVGLKARRKELEEQRDKVDSELAPLTLKHSQAEKALGLTRAERVKQEMEFIEGVNSIFVNSAVDFYKQRLTDMESAQNKVLEKQIAEAKDEFQRELFRDFDGSRWDSSRTVRGLLGKERIVIDVDKNVVEQDFALLLTQGPDVMMRTILANRGLSQSEINDRMEDKDFVQKAQDTLAKQLIMRKIRHGGGITKDQTMKIVSSEWGSKAITDAISLNDEIKKKIDELGGKGILRGSTPAEWIKNHPKGALATLLLALLGVGALPIAAIAGGLSAVGMTAGAEAAIGGVGYTGAKMKDMTL